MSFPPNTQNNTAHNALFKKSKTANVYGKKMWMRCFNFTIVALLKSKNFIRLFCIQSRTHDSCIPPQTLSTNQNEYNIGAEALNWQM